MYGLVRRPDYTKADFTEEHLLGAIREKFGDAILVQLPDWVRQEARLTLLPGKAQAVIGMWRAGKTLPGQFIIVSTQPS